MDGSNQSGKALKTYAIIGFCLLMLIFRVYHLQISRGEEFLLKSQSNFIQERPIAHSRGWITDREGRPLVDNRPSYDIFINTSLLPNEYQTLLSGLGYRKIFRPLRKSLLAKFRAWELNKDPEKIKTIQSDVLRTELCDALKDRLAMRPAEFLMLVPNGGACHVQLSLDNFSYQRQIFDRLSLLLPQFDADLEEYWRQMKKRSKGLRRFKPVLFIADVGFDAFAKLERAISLGDLPAVMVFDGQKRRYIYGSLASHLVGYLNEVRPFELRNQKEYLVGDLIGREGVEKSYEAQLRGADGVERFVVDAKGRRLGEEADESLLPKQRVILPSPGFSLELTLDKDLQKVAEESFLGTAGSIIAMDPFTGEILALASFPSFDPNLLGSKAGKEVVKALSRDPLKPWLNKTIQEHYAPGSTFKAISAVAGLSKNLISPEEEYHCPGYFYMGKHKWRCFKRDGHGSLDLMHALKASCDAYFYQLAARLGLNGLAEVGRTFGFGSKTGIDLRKEIPGIMPDTDYYLKRRGFASLGFAVNNIIGQGDVTATPMQLAVAYGAILNGGKVLKPHIVRKVIASDGKVIMQAEPKIKAELDVPSEHLQVVREGLSFVTQKGGTAYGLRWNRDFPEVAKWIRTSKIRMGGKTGTAQVVRLKKSIRHLRPEDVPYEKRDHAWFVGFAPAENPEILVVVMTEHGGFGGTVSAPVAAAIMKAYFDKQEARAKRKSQKNVF